MPLDTTLLDLDRAPTIKEMQAFFKKHDWSAAKISDPKSRTTEHHEAISRIGRLTGIETMHALSNINADIVFFSSQSVNDNGDIPETNEEENHVKTLMIKSANTKVFLCDSTKFNKTSTFKLCNLNNIDYAVFDRNFEGLNTQCKII